MTTAKAVIARAKTQLGYVENPPGSNRTKYGDWYGMTGPWCAMFVSWVFFMEGLPLPASTAKGFAYTPSGAAWFQQHGHWAPKAVHPKPGWVVFYDFPGGPSRISHVGIVEQVQPDGTFYAIEGNTDSRGGRTGGRVMRQHRGTSGVVGYGIPGYSAEQGDDLDMSENTDLLKVISQREDNTNNALTEIRKQNDKIIALLEQLVAK